jgi:hypothetical protein
MACLTESIAVFLSPWATPWVRAIALREYVRNGRQNEQEIVRSLPPINDVARAGFGRRTLAFTLPPMNRAR